MVVLGKTAVHFTPSHPTGKMVKFDTKFSPTCSEGLQSQRSFLRKINERTNLVAVYVQYAVM